MKAIEKYTLMVCVNLLKKFHFLTLFKFKFNGSERVNKIHEATEIGKPENKRL